MTIDPDLPGQTRRIYRDNAVEWDRHRSRDLFERQWLDRIRAIHPTGTVLDVGCGGGDPIARYFIDHGHAVTGVDFAPEMLAIARDRWPDHRWIEADMRELFLDRRFDILVAFNSFFHLTAAEQPPVISRFADHLNPGGVLWFSSGPGAGEVTGTVVGDTVYHASLSPDAYLRHLHDAGFTDIDFVPDDPDCNQHCLWLARRDIA